MKACLVLVSALATGACDVPSPHIDLYLSEGPAQACSEPGGPAATCDDIPLTCDTYMSIRVIDPEQPTTAFISQCEQVTPNNKRDLCALSRISLDIVELPYRDLEVQVAVFPADEITFDEVTGAPRCPSGTTYDANDGFPIPTTSEPSPAMGGRTYYRTGDEVINVTLGCTNLEALANEECEGIANVRVRATVDDFDTHLTVSNAQGDQLSVGVGEPRPSDPLVVLNPGNIAPLSRATEDPPAWSGEVGLFTSTACLTVLDDAAESTMTISCEPATFVDEELDMTGVRLTKSSLDKILTALNLSTVPAEGITIGIVLEDGLPVSGQVINAGGATVEYLNASRTMVVGSTTSTGGVFVVRNAPYPTQFSTSRLAVTATGIGGSVANKVTIVVLDVGAELQPN